MANSGLCMPPLGYCDSQHSLLGGIIRSLNLKKHYRRFESLNHTETKLNVAVQWTLRASDTWKEDPLLSFTRSRVAKEKQHKMGYVIQNTLDNGQSILYGAWSVHRNVSYSYHILWQCIKPVQCFVYMNPRYFQCHRNVDLCTSGYLMLIMHLATVHQTCTTLFAYESTLLSVS